VHQFVRNLITEWRRLDLPFRAATVVIAVSGGADSVSLLLALSELRERKKLDHRFVAAHFNHGLRDGASDADEQFVRDLATKLNVELAVGKASSLSANPGNLEQNARRARYDFLRQTAANVGALAVVTGHTINDQAETVLMNLLRGSGPDGLAGMRPVRPLDLEEAETDLRGNPNTILVRPLLTWARRVDTEAYCHHLEVDYRYDTMNEDTAFKRVRIRKVLLPLLEDFNPRIVESLGNTATLMQNLTESADDRPRRTGNGGLPLADLRTASKNEVNDIIRQWLRECRGSTRQLQLKHIQAIERLVFSTKSGRTAELPGGTVTKRGGSLVYKENKVEN
jgi:tRNA(Ile)-lysidine synthase